MFDLAALSLPAAAPAPAAAPLQNGGNPAESGDQAAAAGAVAPALAFDALLALQITPADPADAPLPESGKILPDAAKIVAALPPVRPADLPARPSPARTKADTQTDGSSEPDGQEDVEPEAVALPDPSLIAAVFAAPDRLALTSAQTAPTASSTGPQLQPVASQPQAGAMAAAQPQASRSAANIAMASSAQIDLETQPETQASAPQQATPALPATAQLVAARQARQAPPARGSDSEQPVAANAPVTPLRASFTPNQESAEVVPVEAPTAVAIPLERPTQVHETAAPAAIRGEARPERVDFATLVDTLARGRPADLPAKPLSARTKADTQTDGSSEPDGQVDVAPEAVALPDPSLIAAVFAAPDRLALTSAQTAPTASSTAPQLQPVASQPQAGAMAAAQPQASRSAANIALASSAQIDLDTQPEAQASAPQQAAPALPATAQLVAARQARQAGSARGSDSEQPVAANAPATPLRASFTPDQESAEVVRVEAPTAVAVPLERPVQAHETAAPAAIRSEARPERVDFATLVDTLARAREDASPHTVNVSVSHTEFGRVSLRFEADKDRGMTVAMSSADPGFARAVSATTEARGAGQTNAQAQQQQTPSDARAQTGQGESQRHQPQPAERTPSRAAANPSAPNREDRQAPDGERGIYA